MNVLNRYQKNNIFKLDLNVDNVIKHLQHFHDTFITNCRWQIFFYFNMNQLL